MQEATFTGYKGNRLFFVLFIIAAVFILYGNTFNNGFIVDDHCFIVTNPYIKDLRYTPLYFSSRQAVSSWGHGIWRPARTLSYALDYAFWSLHPQGYHLTNILLHGINGLLVFWLCLLLFSDSLVAFLAALLFVSHPIHCPAVAVINSRSDLLLGICVILGTIYYLKGLRPVTYLCYILGLFSKETAIVWPLVLLGVDFCILKRRPKAKFYAGFLLIALVYLACRFMVLGSLVERSFWRGNFYYTVLTDIRIVAYYPRLLLVPWPLKFTYRVLPSQSLFEPEVIVGALVILLLIAAAIITYRKGRRVVSFFIIWYLLFLAPTLNFIPPEGLVGDRFLYVPSLGYYILLAFLIVRCARWDRPGSLIFALMAMVLAITLLGSYGMNTVSRNTEFKDEYTIWKKMIEQARVESLRFSPSGKTTPPDEREIMHSPSFAIPYNNTGVLLFFQGRPGEAVHRFRQAISLKPDYGPAHYNLALSLLSLKPPQVGEARQHVRIAESLGVKIDPSVVQRLLEKRTNHEADGNSP